MTHTPATCTVFESVLENRRCDKPAVWSNGEFAECAKHSLDPVSLSAGANPISYGPALGDPVVVHRHGKDYTGKVVRITRTGVLYAEVTYNNGATKVVRV